MTDREELLALLKSYAKEWHIEGNNEISLETALDKAFDKLFSDKHHIREVFEALQRNNPSQGRDTLFKNIMQQSLAFVKGDFRIGDNYTFIFVSPKNKLPKYQTLRLPESTDYLLKRRLALAHINELLNDKKCVLLRGKSGMGKSVLAAHYYHEYGVGYDFLMWLRYENNFDLPYTFIRYRNKSISLTDLIAELKSFNLPQPEIDKRCAEHIAKYWSDLDGKKLIILDGVENADALTPFFYLLSSIENAHILITAETYSTDSADFLKGLGVCWDMPLLTPLEIESLAEALTQKKSWSENDLALIARVGNLFLQNMALRQCPKDNPQLAEEYLEKLHKVGFTEGGENKLLKWLMSQARLSAGHRWILLQWAVLPDTTNLELDVFNRICGLEDKTIFYSTDFHFFKGNADHRLYKTDIEPFQLPNEYQTDLLNGGWLQCNEDDGYSLDITLRRYLLTTYGVDWNFVATQAKSLTVSFFVQEEIGYEEPDDNLSRKCQKVFEAHLAYFMSVVVARNTDDYRSMVAKYVVTLQAQYNMPLLGEWLEKQLDLWEKSKGENAPTTCNKRHNLGNYYFNIAEYNKALVLFEKNLPYFKWHRNHQGEGVTLNNIGQIYYAKGDYDTALRYLEQSLAIQQQIGDRQGEGATLNNIGQIYDAKGDYDTALRYWEQSLAIQQQIGDRKGEGATLNNLAGIAKAKGDYDTALRYLEQSLAIMQQIGDIDGLATTLNNIGTIFFEQKNDMEKAISYLMQSFQIFQKIGSPDIQYPERFLNAIKD